MSNSKYDDMPSWNLLEFFINLFMFIYKFRPKIYYQSYVMMMMMMIMVMIMMAMIQCSLKVCETVCSGMSTLQDHRFQWHLFDPLWLLMFELGWDHMDAKSACWLCCYWVQHFQLDKHSHPSVSLTASVFCEMEISSDHSFISIQPWRPGLAGTRAQSCNRYGSGTLHPGKILGGSLPLLSPAFRRSHFSRQVPPSATTWEILAVKGGTVGEKDFR